MSPSARDAIERAADAARKAPRVDPKGWARELVRRWSAGESFPAMKVRFAHEALGLPVPKGCK